MKQNAREVVLEGGCLCGDVRYRSGRAPSATVHCYCSDCRRIGGTGHATHTVIPDTDFEIGGVVSEYLRVADSGNHITRRFCPKCGSAIYHTREGLPDKIVLRTSSLDDPEMVTPDRIIYTDSAVSWDYVDPSLPASPKMTGQK